MCMAVCGHKSGRSWASHHITMLLPFLQYQYDAVDVLSLQVHGIHVPAHLHPSCIPINELGRCLVRRRLSSLVSAVVSAD